MKLYFLTKISKALTLSKNSSQNSTMKKTKMKKLKIPIKLSKLMITKRPQPRPFAQIKKMKVNKKIYSKLANNQPQLRLIKIHLSRKKIPLNKLFNKANFLNMAFLVFY